jgi:hypothetical protein
MVQNNSDLLTVNITGGGTREQVIKALKEIASRLIHDQEIDDGMGDVWAEIIEVCPYHQMDIQTDAQ